jgi:hypothetical protein
MAKVIYRYTYEGNNNFTSPLILDDSIQEIKAFVNGVEVLFNQLTTTSIELVNEPITNDVIIIERQTYDTNRVVDFTNGNVLSEKDLDKDSNQQFWLYEELRDADEQDKIYLENKIDDDISNIDVSELSQVDSSEWGDNLDNQITTVQEALNIVNGLVLDEADPDKITIAGLPGSGNLGSSGTLTEVITSIDNLDTDDTIEVSHSNGSIPQGTYTSQTYANKVNETPIKNSETTTTELNNGNGITGDDVQVTTINPNTGQEETNTLTQTWSNVLGKKPTISHGSSQAEDTQMIVTITNYDSDSTYRVEVDGGVVNSIVGDTITWTLPSVSIDTTLNIHVQLEKPNFLLSEAAIGEVIVTNNVIVPDQDLIWNTDFTLGDVENLVNMDIIGNVLVPNDDISSVESIVDSQNDQGDWLLTSEEVNCELKEISSEVGTTNALLRTKDLIENGDKLIFDNIGDGSQDKLISGTPNEVLEGEGDDSITNNGSSSFISGGTQEFNDEVCITTDGRVIFNRWDNTLKNLHVTITESDGTIVKSEFTILNTGTESLYDLEFIPLSNSNFLMVYGDSNEFVGWQEYTSSGVIVGSLFTTNFKGAGMICGRVGSDNVIIQGWTGVNNDQYLKEYTSSGTIVSNVDITGTDMKTYHQDSVIGISNGNILASIRNYVAPYSLKLVEFNMNGEIVNSTNSLYGSNTWKIYNVIENSDEYIIHFDKAGSGQSNIYNYAIINKSSFTELFNDSFYPVQYDIDKYYLIGPNNFRTYEKNGSLSSPINYTSGGPMLGASQSEFLSMALDDNKNVNVLAGTTLTSMNSYTINVSPGVITYEVDISSLGYTVAPDYAYYDPDITFSSSLVATAAPESFTSKSESSFNITVLGNLEQTFTVGSHQGRDYKWKIEVPKNNLENIWYVKTSMDKIGS